MQEAVKGVDSEASLRLNNFYIKNSKIKTRKETNPEVTPSWNNTHPNLS